MYCIQQRSKSYYFRIAVPLDLRSNFPVREIKKSLGMISQRQVQALAGQLALDTLNTFDRVRVSKAKQRKASIASLGAMATRSSASILNTQS